jgi:hypothetical protein
VASSLAGAVGDGSWTRLGRGEVMERGIARRARVSVGTRGSSKKKRPSGGGRNTWSISSRSKGHGNQVLGTKKCSCAVY